MDSLEANFPQWFPKTPSLQEIVPLFRRYGHRGFANDEVINPGNQMQCEQTYLDGLLLEQMLTIDDAEEPIDPEAAPVLLEVCDSLNELKEEVQRLKSHPELFSDDLTRKEFLQKSSDLSKQTTRVLDGHMDDVFEIVRLTSATAPRSASAKTAVTVAKREPWMTWCGLIGTPNPETYPVLKDFMAAHPEMILVGMQLIPHMGVLIAEHWRRQVEGIVTDIAQNYPEIDEQFPKVERMLSGTTVTSENKMALLKFTVPQPSALKSGHIFAFGPQDRVAKLARLLAVQQPNPSITNLGFPRAVMMGIFVNREEAKNYPHLTKQSLQMQK
ncbi:uncharacterized protein RCC_01029 [Ramularia collo-cygni]|uniref:Uncharacterized protein n=1 Tax=Ramularia collo-cygni TaxID=112498 RepID=A0A2D3UTH8_9PEZI|nr:uncharacterized protein RCC_01029 [Ramularia collo-cygni]CZT15137.1 uncharacterized protein RCC_01029 [Ramularia collo-cygni]